MVATRGGESPMTRGGSVTNDRSVSDLRKSVDPEKSRDLKREQKSAQFALRHQLSKKPTWEEIGPVLKELDTKMLSVHARTEAIFLTLRRINPDFSSIFNDSLRRIRSWRETVNKIIYTVNLSEIRDIIVAWNADSENPPISGDCFPEDWSVGKFTRENPDATISTQEKRELMTSLRYSVQFINNCCPESEEVEIIDEPQK